LDLWNKLREMAQNEKISSKEIKPNF